jgi:hypothetical protein
MLLVFAWEHWLGKTTKIDANSTIQLIMNLIKKLLEKKP